MALKNDRLIHALLRQPVDMTPIWIMRQAGRYLPEYRELRAKAKNFLTLCKTPELACEATMQPLRRFSLDAAIIFSDILTIPDAMGLELYFTEGEGPRFQKPIVGEKDITHLPIPDINKLNYVMDAIRLTKKELADTVPLIGFAGSPWTLATYMIENGSSKTFSNIKKMMFNEPVLLHQLLNKLAESVANYLNAQISAGVNAIMIFDTWGGILTPHDYEKFSLHYMTEIIKKIKHNDLQQSIPIILFTKGGGQWLEIIAQSGCDAIGLDWTINIGDARKRIGNKVALQGNMDPAVLYATPDKIREEAASILNNFGTGTGHIFNLGHGIYPDVPYENVKVLIDAVHELSKNKRNF